ncbi:(2Fe-2S) ferredoxin domain-containing protein [Alkalihalobacterium sp. APHAB7]|uniref:(2Fe-2S) ferredoxin domain-containing protein n=1 Tax=Alkalihalobacterium sp. APHAB7 TaxID=3402081 RepID=UPI003AAD18A8
MATWNLSNTKHHVLICNGSSCNKAGAEALTQSIRHEITAKNLDNVIHTTRTLCNGRCHDKCVVIQYPESYWYKEMTSEDAPHFINSLLRGTTLKDKISHYHQGTGFERTEGTVLGTVKDEQIVKKVSKKL